MYSFVAMRASLSPNCQCNELWTHASLQKLYHVAGVEGKPVVFLLTDTQISKESFLEDVNNLLNSGEVPGMYAPEDKERILAGIRDWLLTQGAPTTKVRFTCCSSVLSQAALCSMPSDTSALWSSTACGNTELQPLQSG